MTGELNGLEVIIRIPIVTEESIESIARKLEKLAHSWCDGRYSLPAELIHHGLESILDSPGCCFGWGRHEVRVRNDYE